jgi:hypothetical protein
MSNNNKEEEEREERPRPRSSLVSPSTAIVVGLLGGLVAWGAKGQGVGQPAFSFSFST